MRVDIHLKGKEVEKFSELFELERMSLDELVIDGKDLVPRVTRMNHNILHNTAVGMTPDREMKTLKYSATHAQELELSVIVQPDEHDRFFRRLTDLVGEVKE